MSTTIPEVERRIVLSERQHEILLSAIEILASEGYSSLTLRALARKSGMKLGALQHHFRTWEDMLRALAGYIADVYRKSFDALRTGDGRLSLQDFVRFILADEAGSGLQADRLLPQLWAMARVEPLMAALLDDIYARYLRDLETCLTDVGSPAPHADALALMSLLEGTTLFVGDGCRWADDADAVHDAVLAFVAARYGEKDGSTLPEER